MTFSSQTQIPSSFVSTIKQIISAHQLAIKNGKTRWYFATDYKNVTGCIINGKNKLLVCNKHKKKVVSLLRSVYENEDWRSLQGLIAYCQSIEPEIFKKTKTGLKQVSVYNITIGQMPSHSLRLLRGRCSSRCYPDPNTGGQTV